MRRPSRPPQLECVHCERRIPKRLAYRYPMSGKVAHLRCVSQPSAAATDALLAKKR